MSVHAEAQDRLFGAFPRRRGENLKAWFPRVARELNALARVAGYRGVDVTPRRIRAIWNGEARRIDHHEMMMLELRERVNALQQKAVNAHGELDQLRARSGANRQGRADLGGDRRGTATPGGRGAGEGEAGHSRAGTTEELTLVPPLRFSPRLFAVLH